eukprot:gene20418-65794_t
MSAHTLTLTRWPVPAARASSRGAVDTRGEPAKPPAAVPQPPAARAVFAVGAAVRVKVLADGAAAWDHAVVTGRGAGGTYRCDFGDGEFFDGVPQADVRAALSPVGALSPTKPPSADGAPSQCWL